MIILPAIDIIDRSPVRLFQGDYNQKEIVAESVLDTAIGFANAGAEYIHIVDLDGAKEGKRINYDTIIEVANHISTPIEVGGGIRDLETAAMYLDHGIARVILGTSAIEDEAFLKEAIRIYGDRIAVGLDCKDGNVCTRGWLTNSETSYLDFATHLEALGVSTIIFTDISRDGTLTGPNLVMLEALQKQVSMNIIASGGIKDLSHIEQLTSLNLYGAITGKAMYAGTLDLKQAIQISKR